ncbi:MAG TPA: YajQ family cyclic di-GMP-binding protein [Phycisphaerales bacterium]|nr:YajQ family cyclic di-GMP-binding protein [Phycisphaerales bacterium]
MPSFDIVSRLNFAELDNAINNTLKAVAARFDYRGTAYELTVDRKEKKLKVVGDDDGKVKGIREMFQSAAVKRGLDVRSFEWGEIEPTVAGKAKCEVKLRDGIPTDAAKAIQKAIKESKLKVTASIQEDELRVTGKQIDDLQAVMGMCRAGIPGVELPLQFVNMKS